MRRFLFVLLFAVVLPSHAAENNFLVVHLHSGTRLTFSVEEKPQITFEGSILCINTERYQISDVRKYTFDGNEEADIQEIEGSKNSFKFLDGERISVSVKDPSAIVRIYSSKGIEYPVKRENNANGNVVINMTGLMPDVYIITIGDETIKIRKR